MLPLIYSASCIFVKLLSSLSESLTPVVLCASSQTIRSNFPYVPAVSLRISCWAACIASMDWYVENTTVSPLWFLYNFNCFAMLLGFVVAGTARSTTLSCVSSKSFLIFREARLSEQIQMPLMGFTASAHQAFRLCPKREIEGTIKSTNPLLFSKSSAIFNAVYVFPVPQAMISFPLSCS